MYISFIVIVKR